MPLYFATVLRRVLAVDALVHIDLLEMELLAMVEHRPGIVGEEAAPLARVLSLVVVVGVDDGLLIASSCRQSCRLLSLLRGVVVVVH